ncbi:MAG: KH domain-containing protein [Anaerolineaceae bacterium]|jgi:predicted RNA-binding protein YlqC (UPF0109 family)|nr:KH domain-containing protein [Anaerolineaceae bacterium]
MKELVEYIARALVDDPMQVMVRQEQSSGSIRIELRVAKKDMGRVIGKGGRVANSMRILSRVASAREEKQVYLDVIEPR